MAVITPTLTVRSNANSAASNPGPLSVALSLSGSDVLTVDNANSKIVTVGTGEAMLYDGSIMSGSEQTDEGSAGTYGGFLYFKNITASGTNVIYIGLGSDTAETPLNMQANPAEAGASGNAGIIRLMTLRPGEFVWMPFDYTYNIFVDANAADQKLECWHFNKSAS